MFRELPPRGPDGPRALTHEMIVDARHPGRFLRTFGAIWMGVCLFLALLFGMSFTAGGIPFAQGVVGGGIAFGAVGLFMLLMGRHMQQRALHLFRHGDEARGEVIAVELDTMQRVNQQHPWKVRYRFELRGDAHEGTSTYWTTDPPEGLGPGREIVVLHDPQDPGHNLLWAAATPPLHEPAAATGAETDVAARVRIADGTWRDGPYGVTAAQAGEAAENQAAGSQAADDEADESEAAEQAASEAAEEAASEADPPRPPRRASS